MPYMYVLYVRKCVCMSVCVSMYASSCACVDYGFYIVSWDESHEHCPYVCLWLCMPAVHSMFIPHLFQLLLFFSGRNICIF